MKILVSDDVSEKGVELLRQHGYDVDVKTNLDEQGLIACIGEYDGLVTRSMTHVTEKVIEAGTKLKVVGRAGVGVDSIDIKAATQRGIMSSMHDVEYDCGNGTYLCYDHGHYAAHSAGP